MTYEVAVLFPNIVSSKYFFLDLSDLFDFQKLHDVLWSTWPIDVLLG